MTAMMLGGMISPSVEEAAVTAIRKVGGVALLDHGGDEDAADTRRIGGGGAGDAGKDHADEHIHVGDAAPDPPDDRIAALDELIRDA